MLKLTLVMTAALLAPASRVHAQVPSDAKTVVLAAASEAQETGLLEALAAAFPKAGGCSLKVLPAGAERALQLGRSGEAGLLLTNAPEEEKKFMAEGFGSSQTVLMHNDFVILGPAADPAQIRGERSAVAAFTKIAASSAPFVSCADRSGTHLKELKLWGEAGTKPREGLYLEAAQGMTAALKLAYSKGAYVLADRASFFAQKKKLRLVLLSAGDEVNPYALTLVNPAKAPRVNAACALSAYEFLLSVEARLLFENFGMAAYGRKLYYYDYMLF